MTNLYLEEFSIETSPCDSIDLESLILNDKDGFTDTDVFIMSISMNISFCYWEKFRPNWLIKCDYHLKPYDCLKLLNSEAVSDYWKTFTYVQRIRRHVKQKHLSNNLSKNAKEISTLSRSIALDQKVLLDQQRKAKKNLDSIMQSSTTLIEKIEEMIIYLSPFHELLDGVNEAKLVSQNVMKRIYSANIRLYYCIQFIKNLVLYVIMYLLNSIIVIWSARIRSLAYKILVIAFIVDIVFIDVFSSSHSLQWKTICFIITVPLSILLSLTMSIISTNQQSERENQFVSSLISKLEFIKNNSAKKQINSNRELYFHSNTQLKDKK